MSPRPMPPFRSTIWTGILICLLFAFGCSQESQPALHLTEPNLPVFHPDSAAFNPAVPGNFATTRFRYGPDTDSSLRTDISMFFDNPNPVVVMQGITMDAAPLRAEVVAPVGDGPFPIVLLVHGNFDPAAPSEEGYRYLQELLASRGMIAVSVDENFLNGALNEMDARAIILLRHLQRWRNWNEDSGHAFAGKVDLSRVGLMGHSRGGEAIVAAHFFNTMLHKPAEADFNFNFGIRGLAGLAPVDTLLADDIDPFTGTPYNAGNPLVISGADYFVMHGSHDGDEPEFPGASTYDRALPAGDASQSFKSLIFIHGARHQPWNTVWQELGNEKTSQSVIPLSDYAPDSVQVQFAKVYVPAFFMWSLMDYDIYKDLFTREVSFDSLPDSTTFMSQYQDPNRMLLNGYEEDQDPITTSIDGGENADKNLRVWTEVAAANAGEGYFLWQETRCLVAAWQGKGCGYTVSLPPGTGTALGGKDHLSLRIAQVYEPTDTFNTAGSLQDLSIQLKAGNKKSKEVSIGEVQPLSYPQSALTQAGGLVFRDFSKTVMQTVRIPLAAFLDGTSGFDLNQLSEVTLHFDQTTQGKVVIDDIQFTE